jgi:FkbM family methyltransferase
MSLSAEVVRRLPAGRYRVMDLLSRRPAPPFVARLPGSRLGLRFECDVRNALAREVFFTGRYEPQETCLIQALLGPGDTFLDVGAHWGYFSLLAAERVGRGGRVLAVEADPRIYALLSRNAQLNALPQLELLHVAAAARAGTVTLEGYDEAQSNWGISRVVEGPASDGRFEVPARALDEVLEERGMREVQLVKMDIEGAETFALAGMARGLAERRYRRLLLELHPRQLAEHGTDAAALCAELFRAGYSAWRVRHSAADTRRAAYAASLSPSDVLVPAEPGAPLDDWPHLLWVAPGVEAPVATRA